MLSEVMRQVTLMLGLPRVGFVVAEDYGRCALMLHALGDWQLAS